MTRRDGTIAHDKKVQFFQLGIEVLRATLLYKRGLREISRHPQKRLTLQGFEAFSPVFLF